MKGKSKPQLVAIAIVLSLTALVAGAVYYWIHPITITTQIVSSIQTRLLDRALGLHALAVVTTASGNLP